MDERKIENLFKNEIGVDVTSINSIHKGINTVFLVKGDKQNYILKIGTTDNESVLIEPYILEFLGKNSVPVPDIYFKGSFNNYPSFISEFLEGSNYGYPSEISADKIISLSRKVGQALGKIQSIEMDMGYLKVSNNELTIQKANWETIIHKLLEKFISQAKYNYRNLGSEASRLAYNLDIPSAEKGRLCPLDLHTDNVFLDSNGQINGIIDMERVHIGHPRLAYDINLYSLYAGKEEYENEIKKNFAKGYSSERSVPEEHSFFEIFAILREMRAAHIWWDNKNSRTEILKEKIKKIDSNNL